jgi:hypothetical protein
VGGGIPLQHCKTLFPEFVLDDCIGETAPKSTINHLWHGTAQGSKHPVQAGSIDATEQARNLFL